MSALKIFSQKPYQILNDLIIDMLFIEDESNDSSLETAIDDASYCYFWIT